MRTLTPSQRGAIAEAAVTATAIELGFTVLRPSRPMRPSYEPAISFRQRISPGERRCTCECTRRGTHQATSVNWAANYALEDMLNRLRDR